MKVSPPMFRPASSGSPSAFASPVEMTSSPASSSRARAWVSNAILVSRSSRPAPWSPAKKRGLSTPPVPMMRKDESVCPRDVVEKTRSPSCSRSPPVRASGIPFLLVIRNVESSRMYSGMRVARGGLAVRGDDHAEAEFGEALVVQDNGRFATGCPPGGLGAGDGGTGTPEPSPMLRSGVFDWMPYSLLVCDAFQMFARRYLPPAQVRSKLLR